MLKFCPDSANILNLVANLCYRSPSSALVPWQRWGGTKGLKLWSFLQPSPTPPGGSQRIMKLLQGHKRGKIWIFPFWAPLPPSVSGEGEGSVSLEFREDLRLMCSECLKGHKPGRNRSRSCVSGSETTQMQSSMGEPTLVAFEFYLLLSLTPHVTLGWPVHHPGPQSPYLVNGNNDITCLLCPRVRDTNEEICVREPHAVIDNGCLSNLGWEVSKHM